MDPSETLAQFGKLLDQRIGKLEDTIVEQVTLAVTEKVSDIVNKNVDKKIDEAIAPLVKKQEDHELRTGTVVESMQKQISKLEELVKSHPTMNSLQNLPLLPANNMQQHVPSNHPPCPLNDSSDANGARVLDIVRRAKCVIGIAPVTPDNVDQQDAGPNGLVKAALEYLYKELNVRESEVSESDIESVFLPPTSSSTSFTKVYVRFKTCDHVALCLKLAKSLTDKTIQVSRYFPRQFSDRIQAMGRVAYQLRNSAPPYKTSIEYAETEDDVVLMVCLRGQHNYQRYSISNLPPIDTTTPRSPPVGRKNQSKRARSLSQSPQSDTAKKDRRFSPDKDQVLPSVIVPGPADSVSVEENNVNHDTPEKIPNDTENGASPPPAPLPIPSDIGTVSNFQAMSPATGKISFDFVNNNPSRRLSLNF